MAEAKKEGAVTKVVPRRAIARRASPFEETDRMFDEPLGPRWLRR